MEDCKFVAIPIYHRMTSSLSSKSQLADAMTYKQLIDNLIYLTISRSYISFAMNIMVWFMQKLYVEHLNNVKKILRYVTRMKDITLKYFKLPFFILSRFSSSNNGGYRDDRKSPSAYVFSISLYTISWASKKKPIISLSTIEVKYRAISLTTQEVI